MVSGRGGFTRVTRPSATIACIARGYSDNGLGGLRSNSNTQPSPRRETREETPGSCCALSADWWTLQPAPLPRSPQSPAWGRGWGRTGAFFHAFFLAAAAAASRSTTLTVEWR